MRLRIGNRLVWLAWTAVEEEAVLLDDQRPDPAQRRTWVILTPSSQHSDHQQDSMMLRDNAEDVEFRDVIRGHFYHER